MYDPTIHAATIERQITASDFKRNPQLLNQAHRAALVSRAVQIGRDGFASIALHTSKLRGKDVYQLTDLSEELVLRHLCSNIRLVTGVKQDNRQFIVECVKRLLEEGVAFRVHKYDVASFYESVQVGAALTKLEEDVAFSAQSVRALRSFFDRLSDANVAGLPRGMSISATLSEYIMRSFDANVSISDGVWFFARFVDDILIVSDNRLPVSLGSTIKSNLPAGLSFNQKSVDIPFEKFSKGKAKSDEGSFSFLGYEFTASTAYRDTNNRIRRDVRVDLSSSKVRRLKTRVSRCLVTYKTDGNYNDLRDRLRLLTGNYRFRDLKTGATRSSGIYFNYPLVDSSSSVALDALDSFLRGTIMSPHPRNRLRPHLTPQQRRELCRLTFRSGFEDRRFFAYNPTRLAQLVGCWAYV